MPSAEQRQISMTIVDSRSSYLAVHWTERQDVQIPQRPSSTSLQPHLHWLPLSQIPRMVTQRLRSCLRSLSRRKLLCVCTTQEQRAQALLKAGEWVVRSTRLRWLCESFNGFEHAALVDSMVLQRPPPLRNIGLVFNKVLEPAAMQRVLLWQAGIPAEH